MRPALATAALRELRPFWVSSSPMLEPWGMEWVLECVYIVLNPMYVWRDSIMLQQL